MLSRESRISGNACIVYYFFSNCFFIRSKLIKQFFYLSKKQPLTNETFFLVEKNNKNKSKQILCNIQHSNFVTIKFIKWHVKDISWNKTEILKRIILIFWGQILSNIRRRCGQRKCGRHTKIWRRGIWGYGNEYALCQQENQICLGCQPPSKH